MITLLMSPSVVIMRYVHHDNTQTSYLFYRKLNLLKGRLYLFALLKRLQQLPPDDLITTPGH